MLKEWIWWQIEASLEHLEDDSSIPLSDLTICFWMALAVNRCVGLFQEPNLDDLQEMPTHAEITQFMPVHLFLT